MVMIGEMMAVVEFMMMVVTITRCRQLKQDIIGLHSSFKKAPVRPSEASVGSFASGLLCQEMLLQVGSS